MQSACRDRELRYTRFVGYSRFVCGRAVNMWSCRRHERWSACALSDQDRIALLEAAADPRWIRMGRGDAFEPLVYDDGE